MIQIEVSNLKCKVIDADTGSVKAIDDALSVMTPGCEFSSKYKQGFWDGRTRFFTRNSFPTGLLSDALQVLDKRNVQYKIIDKRSHYDITPPEEVDLLDSKLGHITLRDYQHESVVSALTTGRGVVNVATNGGKTEIACGIIKYLLPHLKKGERIVFFTHSKEIFHQSHTRLQERLGIGIGRIGDKIWEEDTVTMVMIPTISKYLKVPSKLPASRTRTKLTNEAEKWIYELNHTQDEQEKQTLRDKIECNHKQIKDTEKKQWDKIRLAVDKTKNFFKRVTVFMGDEVHHASSSTWYDVFMALPNAYYRFGLTGTVDQDEPINVKRLYGCTGPILSKVSNKFLIDAGYSAKPVIHLLNVPEEQDIGKLPYSDARYEGIIYNNYRNGIFIEKILERANSGKQCLIIINEIEHGDIVLDLIQSQTDITVEFSNGKETSKFRQRVLDDLKSGELRILIATSILDEGVDVSGINCLFIMAGGKSMRQILQRVGRGLRKKADGSMLEVFDCIDYHNEYLLQHSLERYRIYKEEGFDIINI